MDESTRDELDNAWAEFLKKEALSNSIDNMYESEPVATKAAEPEPKLEPVTNMGEQPVKNTANKSAKGNKNGKNNKNNKNAKNKNAGNINKTNTTNTTNTTSTTQSTTESTKEQKDNTVTSNVNQTNTIHEEVKKEKSKKESIADSKKDEQIAELKEKVVRNMAEFDNFRKRTEKEKSAMFEIGAKSIVEKILPVIDNFERGLGAITEEEKESAFAQGIDMIYKQLVQSLEAAGVKKIDAVGKEFDPTLHNAVMHIEDESMGENLVTEEFQKGYMYRDSVIRHSLVKVVN